MTAALRTDTGLFVLRLVLGVTFLLHGLDKLGDVNAVQQSFDQLGIPAPAVMAPLVTITEVAGGSLLILGLLTPLAGIALAIDMLVAGLTAHTGHGFFIQDGGYELVLLLGAGCVAVAVAGAGRFSADALALRGRDRPAWRRHMRTLAQQ
jgi:putative oxidoreductase